MSTCRAKFAEKKKKKIKSVGTVTFEKKIHKVAKNIFWKKQFELRTLFFIKINENNQVIAFQSGMKDYLDLEL